jgi:hypothetical protein
MAYIAPPSRSTGDLITAAIWNADVVANEIAIYAGALSVTSQAIGDILYASSTTQFARVAAVAAGQVLTSAGTGTVPAYSATPALTSADMGGTTVYGSRAITVDTGGVLNVVLASAAGDDFTVDTSKLVVEGDTGYVGVGIAAPAHQLDVYRNAGSQYVAHFDQDALTGYGVLIDTDSETAGDPALQISSTAGSLFTVDSNGDVSMGVGSLNVLNTRGGTPAINAVQVDQNDFGLNVMNNAYDSGSYSRGMRMYVRDDGSSRLYAADKGSDPGSLSLYTDETARMSIAAAGTVNVVGTFTAGTKTFQIPHPLPALKDTHHLIHGCIEGPRLDLIYRGTITLVDGLATVDLDESSGMTAGTWELLCRDPQVFVSSGGWDAVRGSVSGSTLTIECQDIASAAVVSWMVVAERQDDAIKAQTSTTADGKLILEPVIPSLPS